MPKHGFVKFTGENISEVNRELGVIVIKPSGVDYDELTPENMVVTDLDDKLLEGFKTIFRPPNSCAKLYKAGSEIESVSHPFYRSFWLWAQAGRDIPFYGTTHADYFWFNPLRP